MKKKLNKKEKSTNAGKQEARNRGRPLQSSSCLQEDLKISNHDERLAGCNDGDN